MKDSHCYTDTLQEAIEKHGSPLLQELNKGETLVKSFIYWPGDYFAAVGNEGLKGVLVLKGTAQEHLKNLPAVLKVELFDAGVENELGKREEGDSRPSRNFPHLAAFNRIIQRDLSAAFEAFAGEGIVWERPFINRRGYDATAYTSIVYDEFFHDDDTIAAIEANRVETKQRREARAVGNASNVTFDASNKAVKASVEATVKA